MSIRKATYHDAPVIKLLLATLAYSSSTRLLVEQLENSFSRDDHQAFVYEFRKEVVGFVSVHFLPQLTFDGGLAVISYLSVEEGVKDQGVGKALEEYVTEQARKRKCDRIQVNGMDWRAPEHAFYKQQGYQEYPNCYTKKLIYTE